RHTRSKRDWSSDVCSSDLGFKPVDPSTASIQGLRYPAGDSLGARCTAKAPCIDRKFVRNDGIGQILIKVARRDHPEGIYVMLDEIGRASCRERVEREVVGV